MRNVYEKIIKYFLIFYILKLLYKEIKLINILDVFCWMFDFYYL